MGLNIGILAGMGERAKEQRQNLLTQEVQRRQSLESFWANQLKDPNLRPEAQEVAFRKYTTLLQTPYGEKIPKEATQIEDFIQVQPQQGQSWMGGQTSRQVEARPMPIPSELPEPNALTVQEIQQGAVPRLDQPVQSMRTPAPQSYEIPMPAPPAAARMPARYTFDEQLGQASRMKRAESEATRAGRAIPIPAPMQAQLGLGEMEQPEILNAAESIYRNLTEAQMRSEERAAALAQQREIAREREEGLNTRSQESNELRSTLAQDAERGRQERAADALALRASIAQMNDETRKMLAQLTVGARELPTDIRKGIAEDTDIVKTIQGLEGMLEDPESAKEIEAAVGNMDRISTWVKGTVDWGPLKLSDTQKTYLAGLGIVSTYLAHPLFGASLTTGEQAALKRFLPSNTTHASTALTQYKIARGFLLNRVWNKMQSMTSPQMRTKVAQEVEQLGLDPAELEQYGRNPLYNSLPAPNRIQQFPAPQAPSAPARPGAPPIPPPAAPGTPPSTAGASGGGGFSVTVPGGRTFTFDTQEQLNQFKREAGLP